MGRFDRWLASPWGCAFVALNGIAFWVVLIYALIDAIR